MAGPTPFYIRRTSVAERAANTSTLPDAGELAINMTDQIMYSTNGSIIFEIGANVDNQVIRTGLSVGNDSVNVTANSTQVNTNTLQAVTGIYVGDNVDITTTGLFVGNSTINTVVNSTSIYLANSTVNTFIAVPTSAQYTGDYFLHANGTWATVVAAAAADGANTEIQYNLSGAMGANQNFTFDEATSTLTVGNSIVNATFVDAAIYLANSTVNTSITIPNATEYAGDYFLHANGNWIEVTAGSSVYVYQAYTATAGQTTFTVASGFTVNEVDVYINGVHLSNTEYTTDGSDVVLSVGALENSIVEVTGYISLSTFTPVASGSNTQVQFNDSMVFGGSDGFTFDKATNNAVVANTLTVGTAIINATNFNATSNNALYLGGTIASGYQTTAGLSANVATLTANDSSYLGGVLATGYVVDADLDAYQTEAGLSANVATLTANAAGYLGTLAAAGYANLSVATFTTSVNVGTNVQLSTTTVTTPGLTSNSLGLYPKSNTVGQALGNTISRWDVFTTGGRANSTGIYPLSNTVGQAFGNTISRWSIVGNTATFSSTLAAGDTTITGFANVSTVVNSASHTIGTTFIANTLGLYHTGTVNAASHTVGATFTANSTVCNAASFRVGTSSVVNSTVISSGGSLLSANVQINEQTADYTLAASDSGKMIPVTNASASTITVLAGLPIGFRCQTTRMGAGTLTVSNTGQTGVLLFSRTGSYAVTAQYGSVSIFQPSANVFVIDGLL